MIDEFFGLILIKNDQMIDSNDCMNSWDRSIKYIWYEVELDKKSSIT